MAVIIYLANGRIIPFEDDVENVTYGAVINNEYVEVWDEVADCDVATFNLNNIAGYSTTGVTSKI